MNRLSQGTIRHRRYAIDTSKVGRARAAKAPMRRRGSLIEVLEDRRLLSTLTIDANGNLTYDAAGAAGALSVSVSGGNYTFTDTDQAITLAGPGTTDWMLSNNNMTATGPAAPVTTLTVGGSSAGQSLTLDFTTGDPLPSTGLTYNPLTAVSGSNTLTLQGGSFTSETYNPTSPAPGPSPGAGTITYSDAAQSNVPITFSNLSPITDTVSSPSFVFNAPAGSTTVNVVDGPIVSGTQTTEINPGGTGAFERVDFANKTVATVNAAVSGATTTVTVSLPAAGLSTLDVTKVAAAPVGTATTIHATAGQAFTNAVVATFTESDLTNKSFNFVASINWGDGTAPSGGVIVPVGTTGFDVEGSHTYANPGTYPVKVTLTDQGTTGSTVVGSTTINITAVGPVASIPNPIASSAVVGASVPTTNSVTNLTVLAIPSAREDVQFTADVATFTSNSSAAVPSNFTATINWGDGTAPSAGTITEDASNVFHVSGTHIYTKPGSFPISVAIKDQNGTLYQSGVSGATGTFNQANLVSSIPGMAAVTDAKLINPWGLAASAAGPLWVSDEGSGFATVYNLSGNPVGPVLTVTIPPATSPGTGTPTGIVFNSDTTATDFTIPGPSGPVRSIFLFATLDGTIAGWNPGSNGGSGSALTAKTLAGAAFTGLAEASVTAGATTTFYLYAANFNPTSGTRGIVVYDPTFTNVTGTTFAGKFVDPNAIPGANPYNIALLNGNLFVTYATPTGPAGTFKASGGYIDEFDTSGNFVKRVFTSASGASLNGPWGMAIAPAGFGPVGGDLLVSNFGDGSGTGGSGTISAIDLTTDTLVGTLSGPSGTIVNPGIWGLLFGNGGASGGAGTLDFAAGISGQAQGLLGGLSFAPNAMATVAAAPLSAQGTTIHGFEGNPLATTAGTSDVLVATFMDTGTIGATSAYTATIDWGDGSTPTTATRITSQGTPNGIVFSVFGNHTYAKVGTYPVTVTITKPPAAGSNEPAPGAMAVASSEAVIVDAALTGITPAPTVTVPEDVLFSGTVAMFNDADPTATIGEFHVTIDWGDGSPQTAGIVTKSGTTFLVSGSHTYADSLPVGAKGSGVAGPQNGTYPITIKVADADGAQLNLTNTATVIDVALTVTGKLNPASDSGVSNSDNITNVVQPNFLGTTNQPFATVSLFAQAAGSASPVLIGQGTSDASGFWSITSNQALADGSYAITAVAVDSSGHTISSTTTIVPDLVIDTVGPKVTGVFFDRLHGRIDVTFQDYGGPLNAGVGLNAATVIDANNYELNTVHHPRVGQFLVNAISDVPSTTSGPQFVTLTIGRGHAIRGGFYDFTIRSVSPTDLTGIQDIAGNALDGEFYGFFPSGNNHPGGDFVTQLTVIHHTVFAPGTVIGRATPVSPPGTRPQNVFQPTTINPGKFPRSSAVVTRASGGVRVIGTAARTHRLDSRAGAHHVVDKALNHLAADRPSRLDSRAAAHRAVDKAPDHLAAGRPRRS